MANKLSKLVVISIYLFTINIITLGLKTIFINHNIFGCVVGMCSVVYIMFVNLNIIYFM